MVPLQPLASLQIKGGDVLYVGDRWRYDDDEPEEVGWVVVDADDKGILQDVDGSTYRYMDEWDYDKTMARHLQPGERLVVTYGGS